MPSSHVLAIDQGTTSTRAVVYGPDGRARGSAASELRQYYPHPGWVEHDAEEIWQAVATVVPQALEQAGVAAGDLAALGLTNQRETSVIWERGDGRPLARALVWQDRRTTDFCRERHGDEDWLRAKTGLVLDPYFSATKLRWLLDRNPSWRAAAEAGKLAAGTIDTFLIGRLTGGRSHVTDVSNASRTLLFDLATAAWDEELCRYFAVPRSLLPEVRPSAADFGRTRGLDFLPDGLPIAGVAGDQQAALFGQCCFSPGEAKCTYGTGAFLLCPIGDRPKLSRHRLLTTLAATTDTRPQYALEGSVFVAGAAVQWLRDGLKLFDRAEQVEALAQQSDPDQPIYFLPGFVGLGAPHWVPEARGAIFGLTRGTTASDLARAALEGVAFQVADLVEAVDSDAAQPLTALHVDGGMACNAWFLQCQADLLGLPVLQSLDGEATARGAAFLAGLQVGVWKDLEVLRNLARQTRRFEPKLPEKKRQTRREQWRRAVKAVIEIYAGGENDVPPRAGPFP